MILIVGLGNPGEEYLNTRHNLGYMIVDRLAKRLGVRVEQRKFRSEVGMARRGTDQLLLVKPQTYMNRSGEAVRLAASFYRTPVENIIVVHDDLDLEFGQIKVKIGGSDGGHKGIKSTREQLGSDLFVRVRMGIGRPKHDEVITKFVLHSFYPEEKPLLEQWIDHGSDAVFAAATEGVVRAANKYNKRYFKVEASCL